MAKQRGVIQLSGRVDNLCYYQQKRVRGGLVRRVNLAMSERLKSDPVFQRTRYANSIFGMCSMLAGTFFDCFGLGSRNMLYPSVQAKFTKFLLSIFQSQQNSSFGYNFEVNANFCIQAAKKFNSLGLYNDNPIFSSFPFTVDSNPDILSNTIVISATTLESVCKRYKVEGLRFDYCRRFDIDTPKFDVISQKYYKGSFIKTLFAPAVFWHLGDGDLTLDLHSEDSVGEATYCCMYVSRLKKTNRDNYEIMTTGGFFNLIYNLS